MQGLSISSLRSIGASVRHASGVNTCARCLQHYFSANESPASGPDECAIHTRDLSSEGNHDDSKRIYPCCSAPAGSRGCTPAPHLPLYQCVNGKVDPQRRIEYDSSMDLKVGRWMSTKVKLAQLNQQIDSVPAPVSIPASAPAPAVSSIPASPSVANPAPSSASAMGTPVPRVGDEIMVCGQLYHTGTPVILWSDVGGYDHYRVERRYCPFDEADWATTQKELPDAFTTPNRFGLRKNGLTPDEIEKVRGGQWDLPTLTKQMKAFVLHYDEAGLSRECFKILQDQRDLSIHFMCDLDGTIYQALDLKERAWQATIENTNSVGCEIANVGAYDPNGPSPFAEWYGKDAQGNTIITIPSIYPNNGGIHTPGFVGSPARPNPIQGVIQGQNLIQYDYTPQQYAALSKLIATFCTIFPAVPLIYPMDGQGNLIRQKLPDAQLANYVGLLGHYHIQTDKIDPGPAMQWNVLISDAKVYMERAQKARAVEAQQRQSVVNEKANEYNLLRKMERKLIAQAEESGALGAQTSDPFYLVSSEWWTSLQNWLHATDGVTLRPSVISNDSLLEGDNRTPKSGLSCPLHYTSVHEKLWKELVEMYGAKATIVRPTNDIYASRSKNGVLSSSAAASSSSASAVSSPALSAHHPPAYASAGAAALSQFVVPAIQPADPDPWIVVTKRVMPSEPNARK